MNLTQVQFEANRLVNTVGRNALTADQDAAGQSPGGALTVRWTVQSGGTPNASTGASVGATQSVLSGTLAAIAVEENARSVVRQYVEIGVGDLIVTLAGQPVVELFVGQTVSGTLPLDALQDYSPQFLWQGKEYVQAQVTDDLRTLWTEAVAGVPLSRGILLKRAT
jgi:hypothetical protein